MGSEVEGAWDRFEGIIHDVLSRGIELGFADLEAASPMDGRDESEPQTKGWTQTDDGARLGDHSSRPAVPVEAKYLPSEVNE